MQQQLKTPFKIFTIKQQNGKKKLKKNKKKQIKTIV